MTRYGRGKVGRLSNKGRLALDNAFGTPEILALFKLYGYGVEKFQEGQTLLRALEESHAAQLRLYAQQKEATAAFHAAWDVARKTYAQHAKIARALLAAQPARLARLGLEGARARAFNKWLIQARQFYREALADAELGDLLAQGGMTRPVLEAGWTAVEAAVQANNAQEAAKGLAQQSTQDRDAAAAAFQRWLRHFWQIADVALADQPQWLERLGRRVRS